MTTAIIPAINAVAMSCRGSGFFRSSRSQNHNQMSAGKIPPRRAIKKCDDDISRKDMSVKRVMEGD